MVRNIKVAFQHLDEEMTKKLIVTMIHTRLKYDATVWMQSSNLNIKKVERIHRASTKLLPGIRNLTYKERLKQLDSVTLEQRKVRDVVVVCMVLRGLEKWTKKVQWYGTQENQEITERR